MKHTTTLNGTGWVLAAGFAMYAFGLARSAPQTQTQTQEPPPPPPVIGTADSNGRMIAVTGIDVTGASILYLVDTVNYQLAVYQANGGTEGTQSVKLVGARRIDLDLRLHGLNDKSKFTYEKLRDEFRSNGLLPDEEPDGGH